MTVLYDVGDGIKGEKISCEFRKLGSRHCQISSNPGGVPLLPN